LSWCNKNCPNTPGNLANAGEQVSDMQRLLSVEFWVELALSLISALLTVLTIARPDWIEGIFDVDPDAGSGSSEWAITLAFVFATLMFAALTRRTWHRDRRSTGFSG
jgi:hypothetical protein